MNWKWVVERRTLPRLSSFRDDALIPRASESFAAKSKSPKPTFSVYTYKMAPNKARSLAEQLADLDNPAPKGS